MSKVITAFMVLLGLTLTANQAQARGHHRHHRHVRVYHRHYNDDVSQHYASHGSLEHVKLDNGEIIVVASAVADRFKGFLNALFHQEGRLPEIGCFSATGHMRNSLHHWGGACDVGQSARNRAWRPMYHITALAHQFGLTDGCEWRHPDCGHIDVSGVGGSTIARRSRVHYAHKGRNNRVHVATVEPSYGYNPSIRNY